MPNDMEDVMKLSPAYLIRILVGLLLLTLGVLAALWSVFIQDTLIRGILISVLVAAAIGLIPLSHYWLRRSDELRRRIHWQACATTLPLLFALFTIIGVLQANHLLPPLNAFWAMGLTLSTWSVSLMLSEHSFH